MQILLRLGRGVTVQFFENVESCCHICINYYIKYESYFNQYFISYFPGIVETFDDFLKAVSWKQKIY